MTKMMLASDIERLTEKGKAAVLVGGQWGSEAKGAIASYLATQLFHHGKTYDVVTTNAGAQAGHTSMMDNKVRVVFHLPTVPLILKDLSPNAFRGYSYLNAGSIIDIDVLRREVEESNLDPDFIHVHPNAAVISNDDREAENWGLSGQTKIASTRKGVGQALARKVLREGLTARDHPILKPLIARHNLNEQLHYGKRVLVEVPQGIGLSLNSRFYPHCTSRDCTPGAGLSDAGIHPKFIGSTILVLRTYPIRVGHIYNADGNQVGYSGDVWPDQKEISWKDIEQVPEITTVTKRVRRVFTFSRQQTIDALFTAMPEVVALTFCNYCTPAAFNRVMDDFNTACRVVGINPTVLFQYGPDARDVTLDRDEVSTKLRT